MKENKTQLMYMQGEIFMKKTTSLIIALLILYSKTCI